MKIPLTILVTTSVLATASLSAASLTDLFKRKPGADAPVTISSLSQDQVVAGLKEALGTGVRRAIENLGKEDGFLKDVSVKIPMPESLAKIEKALRAAGQHQLADDFIATMNRSAEQAVPEAATVLGDSIKQMSIADAKALLTGADDAATQYFRRTSEITLQERFLPIVKAATGKAGVTSAYKQMTEKATGALGGMLGGFGKNSGLLGGKTPDLDSYITNKALDGLFTKIADQEKLIRNNPVERSTDLLKKVFGAVAGK